MKNTELTINKLVYLGLSILNLSKTVLYEFCYNYIGPKYGEKAKLCYVDSSTFIIYIKTGDIYKDVAEDVETRFDTSNWNTDRFFPIGKMKMWLG